MEPNFQFPQVGWRFDGSNSYGTAELYQAIPHVVVKIFLESERIIAQDTFRFLKENGLSTAMLEEVRHTNGMLFFYVFAERQEFLSALEKLFPDVHVSD